MQVACDEYIAVHVNVCAHTLSAGIGLIKETLLVLPIELQSKMFKMYKKEKEKKNTSKKSAEVLRLELYLFMNPRWLW